MKSMPGLIFSDHKEFLTFKIFPKLSLCHFQKYFDPRTEIILIGSQIGKFISFSNMLADGHDLQPDRTTKINKYILNIEFAGISKYK